MGHKKTIEVAVNRAVGYARVSTDRQDNSIPAQVEKIKALAIVKDLVFAADPIEDEDASAKSLERPGMKRMLAMVQAGEVNAVIIAKLDRLTRSLVDLAYLLKLFEKHNVALLSAAESIDTATATGRMIVKIIVLVSEWEREVIGERTRDVLRDMKRRGRQTGKLPYGFRRGASAGVNKKGQEVFMTEPDPEEQSVLALIRKLRTQRDGSFGRGHRRVKGSFQTIAKELNRQGIKTRRGGDWLPQYVHSVLVNAGSATGVRPLDAN